MERTCTSHPGRFGRRTFGSQVVNDVSRVTESRSWEDSTNLAVEPPSDDDSEFRDPMMMQQNTTRSGTIFKILKYGTGQKKNYCRSVMDPCGELSTGEYHAQYERSSGWVWTRLESDRVLRSTSSLK